jgi:hypothetical protein
MSTTALALKCTPRQVKKFVIRAMTSGRVAMVESSPAMGKSAIMRQIAKEYNLKLIDHRLSTSAPEDMSGLPNFMDGVAQFVPFDIFPIEGTELPLWEGETERKFDATGKCTNCYNGWLLFLDEFNSATKMVQAACYKIVLDRMVGQKNLHPNVVMVCAGNLSTDRAIVNTIGTAMQSRLIWLTMELNYKEWLEDVALPQKWDSRIIAYHEYTKGANLYDFRPDHSDKTFCAPRTWEFVNDLLRGQEYQLIDKGDGTAHWTMDEEAALYAGTITSGVAVDFINFTKVFANLPKISVIVKDPENTPIPTDPSTRWATITHLMEYAEDSNFTEIATYVNRLTSEMRVLFFRGLMIQKPELKKHSAFRAALVTLSRYLNDDLPAAA